MKLLYYTNQVTRSTQSRVRKNNTKWIGLSLWRSTGFEHFIQLLSDSDECCPFGQLLQFRCTWESQFRKLIMELHNVKKECMIFTPDLYMCRQIAILPKHPRWYSLHPLCMGSQLFSPQMPWNRSQKDKIISSHVAWQMLCIKKCH